MTTLREDDLTEVPDESVLTRREWNKKQRRDAGTVSEGDIRDVYAHFKDLLANPYIDIKDPPTDMADRKAVANFLRKYSLDEAKDLLDVVLFEGEKNPFLEQRMVPTLRLLFGTWGIMSWKQKK